MNNKKQYEYFCIARGRSASRTPSTYRFCRGLKRKDGEIVRQIKVEIVFPKDGKIIGTRIYRTVSCSDLNCTSIKGILELEETSQCLKK